MHFRQAFGIAEDVRWLVDWHLSYTVASVLAEAPWLFGAPQVVCREYFSQIGVVTRRDRFDGSVLLQPLKSRSRHCYN